MLGDFAILLIPNFIGLLSQVCGLYPLSSSTPIHLPWRINLGMDQYLLIACLGGWTSIYQLFLCSPGVQGFDTLPFILIWWIGGKYGSPKSLRSPANWWFSCSQWVSFEDFWTCEGLCEAFSQSFTCLDRCFKYSAQCYVSIWSNRSRHEQLWQIVHSCYCEDRNRATGWIVQFDWWTNIWSSG